MAHESFEDPDVAAVMNERFVNVKVDREERPDVDAIYMQAVQALAGRGGWPMTVFLDPDGRPFFEGHVLPQRRPPGHAGFRARDGGGRRGVAQPAGRPRRAGRVAHPPSRSSTSSRWATAPRPSTAGVLETTVERADAQFDPRFGGFGSAPKFPQAMTLTFLLSSLVRALRRHAHTVTVSLGAMAAGGMYDQVGGGFHRYSVDAYWLVPHFEKMLYDQALLLRAYVHGWQVTGEARYRRVAEEIVTYVLRDLRHPEGGFFSAEDADSEGIEGKFYCWSVDELREVCGDDADEVMRFYGVTEQGNFEDPHGIPWQHPPRRAPRRGAATRPSSAPCPGCSEARPPGAAEARRQGPSSAGAPFLGALGGGRVRVRSRRLDGRGAPPAGVPRHPATRVRRSPAAILAGRPRAPARRTPRTTRRCSRRCSRWPRSTTSPGSPGLREVARDLIDRFADDDNGGFFTTATTPSRSSCGPRTSRTTSAASRTLARLLLRLAALTGDDEARARHRLDPPGHAGDRRAPAAFAYLLRAVERLVAPPMEVVVVGGPAMRRAELVDELRGRLLPTAVRVVAPPGVGTDLTPLLEGRAEAEARDRVRVPAVLLPVAGDRA